MTAGSSAYQPMTVGPVRALFAKYDRKLSTPAYKDHAVRIEKATCNNEEDDGQVYTVGFRESGANGIRAP